MTISTGKVWRRQGGRLPRGATFLNADRFQRELAAAADEPGLKLLVLEASAIDAIDYTAAQSLASAIRACRHRGVDFAVARLESVRAQTAFACYGLFDALGAPGVDGRERLFHSVDEATRQLAAGRAHIGRGRRAATVNGILGWDENGRRQANRLCL